MRTAKTPRGLWILAMVLILGVLLGSTVTYAAAKVLINPVVVKVNGDDITETEFLYFLLGKYGDDIAEELTEHVLLAQQADQFGLTANRQDGLDYMNSRYSEEKLATMQDAFDLDIIADSLAREVLALNVLSAKSDALIEELNITVTDEEITKVFLDVVDNYTTPEAAHIAWVMTTDQKTADEAKKKLDEGVDFAEVAKEYSEDESSADDDGEVGIIAKGETVGLPSEIEDAVFSQEEGEYSDVISTGEKFFIVKTLKHYPRSEPKFEEVKDEIEERILAQKAGEPLNMWVLSLFEEAEIEVIYPIYQEMSGEEMIPDEG